MIIKIKKMGLRERGGKTSFAKQAAGDQETEESKSSDTSNMALRLVIGLACAFGTLLVVATVIVVIAVAFRYSFSIHCPFIYSFF